VESLNNQLFDSMLMVIHSEIVMKHHGDIFIGGSRRFGYSNANSDLDIFAFLPPLVINQVILDFERNGFVETPKNVDYCVGLYTILTFQHSIHLNIFVSQESFEILKTEHNRVEQFLINNPILTHFIENLKGYDANDSVKGILIYTTLKNLS
jgi:hypothetical protein